MSDRGSRERERAFNIFSFLKNLTYVHRFICLCLLASDDDIKRQKRINYKNIIADLFTGHVVRVHFLLLPQPYLMR